MLSNKRGATPAAPESYMGVRQTGKAVQPTCCHNSPREDIDGEVSPLSVASALPLANTQDIQHLGQKIRYHYV